MKMRLVCDVTEHQLITLCSIVPLGSMRSIKIPQRRCGEIAFGKKLYKQSELNVSLASLAPSIVQSCSNVSPAQSLSFSSSLSAGMTLLLVLVLPLALPLLLLLL